MTPLAFERRTRADLRARRWLRWHITMIGTLTFAACWAVSHGLMRAGVETMAVRHAIALLGAYAIYLLLLWLWARWLLSREEGSLDADFSGSPGGSGKRDPLEPPDGFEPGGGGDFGGAGASGSWDGAVGDAVSGTAEALGSADEGIVVIVPLALVIGAALALGALLGFAVFGLFGVEVLLGVAVEIAFASFGGALAFKAQREGWLGFAFRRTVGPVAVMVGATVLASLALAHWLPQAQTLPQAMRLLVG